MCHRRRQSSDSVEITPCRSFSRGWGLNGYIQSMGFAPGSRLLSNWRDDRRRARRAPLAEVPAGRLRNCDILYLALNLAD
ncbi:hypothetical protein D0N87_13745 [Pseudomonas sp. ATCC 13867]|nr:hypothetical protein D0N87_13745 [Pseudomonas sp. ATCC 13867]